MTREDGKPTSDEAYEVGSLAEEAAMLFGALSGWARDHGADLGHGAGGLADHLVDRVAGAAHQADEHLATGAPECTVCPVCRTVHAVRQLSPEVKAHLAVAASSLMQAAAGLLATVVPDPETDARGDADPDTLRSAGRRTAPVERIVLDDDWPEEDS